MSGGYVIFQGHQKWADERHTSAIKISVTALFYRLEMKGKVAMDLVTLIPMEICGPKLIEARF